jgi:hypothetical protein
VFEHDAASSRRAHALEVLHDGGPVDLELGGEIVDRPARQIARDETIDIGGGESRLDLFPA